MNSTEYQPSANGATPIIPLPAYGGNAALTPDVMPTDAAGRTPLATPPAVPKISESDLFQVPPAVPTMSGDDSLQTPPAAPPTGGDDSSQARPAAPSQDGGDAFPWDPGDTERSDRRAQNTPGTFVIATPRPVTPCFHCRSDRFGMIRFLNAAIGYQPFVVAVNNRVAVAALSYAEISDYGKVSSGEQTISVSAPNGYPYIRRQIRVLAGASATVAIVNTADGLAIVEVNDVFCYTPLNGSCLRVGNLSYQTGPLSLFASNGAVSFRNVRFMEITNYVRLRPSRYDLYVSNVNETLLSTEITVRGGAQYTVYLFHWSDSPTAVRALVVEDRR